jgi:hypothetical protein
LLLAELFKVETQFINIGMIVYRRAHYTSRQDFNFLKPVINSIKPTFNPLKPLFNSVKPILNCVKPLLNPVKPLFDSHKSRFNRSKTRLHLFAKRVNPLKDGFQRRFRGGFVAHSTELYASGRGVAIIILSF